ncbi:MAG: FecR family protein [Lentisphaeraceae bacterium]|nr:FecR family protein [Lentisphaeraceae bacterium]
MIDKEKLILRYLDDALSSDEMDQLNNILEEDVEARDFLYSVSEQSVVLAGMERSLNLNKKKTAAKSPKSIQSKLFIAIAALLAIALTVLVSPQLQQKDLVVTASSVTGSFKWLGDDGKVFESISEGTELPSGSIESMSEQSSIKLTYEDKTQITLFGQFSASLSGVDQKKLNLYKGYMSANVKPQKKPLLISTPTAKMEVLGTTFNVDSSVNNTLLSVSEGAVKLTRKVDAQDVRVKANEAVIAANEATEKLLVKEILKPVHNWKSDFDSASQDSLIGQLVYVDNKAFVKSSPRQIFHAYLQTNTTIHRVGQKLQWRTPAPLILKRNSQVVVKGRMDKAAKLDILFMVKEPKGGFAGNFYKQIFPELDENGNFEIRTSLEGFKKLQNWSQEYVEGLQLYTVSMFTTGVDHNLMGSAIEIITEEVSK